MVNYGAKDAAVGAVKGASQAKDKTNERIQDDMEYLLWSPGNIPHDVKVKGLFFFEVDYEAIKSLKVDLGDINTRTQEKLELELEVLNWAAALSFR